MKQSRIKICESKSRAINTLFTNLHHHDIKGHPLRDERTMKTIIVLSVA
jgi:hypothetical protein